MGGWDCLHYFKCTCVTCRPGECFHWFFVSSRLSSSSMYLSYLLHFLLI